MFKDITIGQFIPGDSFLHKMDARVKIVLSFVYVIALFIINNPIGYIIFTVFTAVLMLSSRVPIKFIMRGLKPMIFILVFTAAINLLMTPGEYLCSTVLFGGWEVGITKEGVYASVKMFLRLLYLIMGTSLLTLTTSPIMLTDGIEMLLKPLEKIKVPAHEIAMMMTIAMRFIPTLAEETDKIMKAQTARGADFETGGILRRAKAMIPLLVPLFISAFRRADELATAMEARCYHGGGGRTRMKQLRSTWRDGVGTAVMVAVCGAAIALEFLI